VPILSSVPLLKRYRTATHESDPDGAALGTAARQRGHARAIRGSGFGFRKCSLQPSGAIATAPYENQENVF
jgi:hypothetical protein